MSDKSITYKEKDYKINYNDNLFEARENHNEKSFEQFKQFIIFQKLIQDK